MSDGQVIAAIIGALVSISTAGWAALRWAVTQITGAINASTAGQKQASDAAAAAQIKVADTQREAAQLTADAMLTQAAAFATMSAKLDTAFRWIEEHTPVEMVRPSAPDPPSERTLRERYPNHNEDHSQPYSITRKNRKS